MKTAYLDCASGISGDMTLGALVDAGAELDEMNEALASLGLADDCRLSAETVLRGGFRATQVRVEAAAGQPPRHLPQILELLHHSDLPDHQREKTEQIFRRLAEAEARVHGIAIDRVHFHELGAVDTIADVLGAIVGFDRLGIERIVASPIPVGSGTVEIAHGRVSVPAPGTAELLRGVPLAESDVECELTTPTGAALVATLAESFGPLPAMTVEAIGCGAGGRDLAEQPNVLRLLVGHATQTVALPGSSVGADRVCLLETNLDDTTGELIGHCVARLHEAGALDVWTTAIQMKKNRPGVLLSALARLDDAATLEAIVLTETETLGVRRRVVDRHVLRRRPHEVTTAWGPVDGKIRWLPDGSVRFSPEYESCRQIAQSHGVSLREVYGAACKAFEPDGIEVE